VWDVFQPISHRHVESAVDLLKAIEFRLIDPVGCGIFVFLVEPPQPPLPRHATDETIGDENGGGIAGKAGDSDQQAHWHAPGMREAPTMPTRSLPVKQNLACPRSSGQLAHSSPAGGDKQLPDLRLNVTPPILFSS
jgi:hypothetical protein